MKLGFKTLESVFLISLLLQVNWKKKLLSTLKAE